MKKISIGLLSVLFVLLGYAQPLEQKIAAGLGEHILQHLDKIAQNSKLGILFIAYNNGITDTLTTRFSLIESKALTRKLSNPAFVSQIEKKLKKRLNIKVVDYSSDVYKFFEPFFKKYLKNIKKLWDKYAPDYYIKIKYRVDTAANGKLVIDFYSIRLQPGRLVKYFSVQRQLPSYQYRITTKADSIRFSYLNVLVDEINRYYKELLSIKSDLDADKYFHILDRSGVAVKDTLYTNTPYYIDLYVPQASYVYIFYFDPYGPKDKKMYLIHPLSQAQNHFFQPGRYQFPINSTFKFYPPPSQLYFKVFLTNKQLPVKVEIENKAQGFSPIISPQDCHNFYTHLIKSSYKNFTKILFLETQN